MTKKINKLAQESFASILLQPNANGIHEKDDEHKTIAHEYSKMISQHSSKSTSQNCWLYILKTEYWKQ